MNTNHFFTITILLIFMGVLTQSVWSKPFEQGDYTQKPRLEVSYSGLEASLRMGFEGRVISGEAVYRFVPRHDQVSDLIWYAPQSGIRQITMDGEDLTYEHDNDMLRIEFDNDLPAGETMSIRLQYESEPAFGVHMLPSGTMFSSNLPGSVAHWLPGPVHPRVAMPVTLHMEVPPGLKAVANGQLQDEEVTDEVHRYVWNTETNIPLTEISFAIGDFEVSETFLGTKQLRVYHEKEKLGEVEREELLAYMVRRIRTLERQLRSELPVNAFHAVVLEDNRWETKHYSAGLTFLPPASGGEREILLSRSLVAQWFGISLRPEQWQESAFSLLLQAVVAEEIEDADRQIHRDPIAEVFDVPQTLYRWGDMNYWQWTRELLRDRQSDIMTQILATSNRDFARVTGVWTDDDFSSELYDLTGRRLEVPEISEPPPESQYRFRVMVEEVRGSDRISLETEPLADITEDTFRISVVWYRDGERQEELLTFSGDGDRLELSPGGNINNVHVNVPDDSDIAVEVEKPFSFWLYQLRRDDDPDRRKEAALALRDFISDPDLQLAIQDIMRREENTGVLAAMYRLMAEATSGAGGTETRFLEGIAHDDPDIRRVSMDALKAYPGHSAVIDQVYSVIQTSEDIALVNTAIGTYRHLIEEEDFRDFAIRFLREDRQDQLFTKTLLRELFEVELTEASVEEAREYLNDGYFFDLRWLAYRLLRRDASGMDWQEDFLNNFQDDADPRVRYLTLFSVSELDVDDRGPFLQSRMLIEYDIRILKKIEELTETF